MDEIKSKLSMEYDKMTCVVKYKLFWQATTLQDKINVLEEKFILEEE